MLLNLQDKIEQLDENVNVIEYLKDPSPIRTFLQGLTPECEVAIKSVLAIGQGPVVFRMPEPAPFDQLRELLQQLLVVEKAYAPIGGIIGYHKQVLALLNKEAAATQVYHEPNGVDLERLENREEVARSGVASLPSVGEIWVVGGAGDRLSLMDEATGEPLPAGLLKFTGVSLLEGLVRETEGREALYRRWEGKELITPIAMMTSQEKGNHGHIVRVCEQNEWWGRPKESFMFFEQPMVPCLTVEGNWAMSGVLQMVRKPGGHGVMWELARQAGVFEWFKEQGRKSVLVRQVNNPVGGIDDGIVSFLGLAKSCDFGFASCKRMLDAAEGMNVLIDKGEQQAITNVEYTEFAQAGIAEVPEHEGSPYSKFPANTNILFAKIDAIEQVVKEHPLPGLMINMKKEIPAIGAGGTKRWIKGGRLETMMQNIADHIEWGKGEAPRTLVTYNRRRKTLSVTKNGYKPGGKVEETPVGCLYRVLENNRELFEKTCGMDLPTLGSEEEYVEEGPGFFVLYHPRLGPVWKVIGEKIKGGRLGQGAEMQLECEDLLLENVQIEGSLLIRSLGGKVVLRDVVVKNRGITPGQSIDHYWRNDLEREECCLIEVEPGEELVIEGKVLEGGVSIKSPN